MNTNQLQRLFHSQSEVYLRVKVVPNAPKNEVIGYMDDGETLKVKIHAVPEKGKANKELIKFFVQEYSLQDREIVIISGKNDRLKLLRVSP